jgi:hypothetical protein
MVSLVSSTAAPIFEVEHRLLPASRVRLNALLRCIERDEFEGIYENDVTLDSPCHLARY